MKREKFMDKLDRKDQEIVWQQVKELIRVGADVNIYEENGFWVRIFRPNGDNVSWKSSDLFEALEGLTKCIDPKREAENHTVITHSWQLCPKCMGEIMPIAPCDICHDEKIISTLNGQPPSKQ